MSSTFAPPHPSTVAPSHPRTLAPFFLHVGDLHPRRNLAMVTTALLAARRALNLPVTLVLAGVDRGVGDDLSRLAQDGGAPDAVVRLGAVDDAALGQLYAEAVALVYPSRYEGFGLPVLEAMASGTPVIAARAGSIPEVLGDAGTLLDPDDASGWTAAMTGLIGDADSRAAMRGRGLARAAAFTWERTARMTADVYRRVSR